MEYEWFARVEAECRARNLTRGERDTLKALGQMLAVGDTMPSEARLASKAGVSKRTVCRAKAAARALGLLAWERRWEKNGRKEGENRGLRRELPCAYRAEQPIGPVVRRERQKGAGPGSISVSRSIQAQLAALPAVTPALVALWAARKAGLAGVSRPQMEQVSRMACHHVPVECPLVLQACP